MSWPTTSPSCEAGDLAQILGIPAFSEEQLDAILAPLEPSVVVAGAGSGKTTVMTARVVWLVATEQVTPDHVLGLTFTNKAAGELSSRVRRSVLALSDRLSGVPRTEVGEPTISTYHAFAGRLIAEHGLRLGVEPGSRLLTEAASVQLAYRIVTTTSRDLAPLESSVAAIVQNVRALDAELAEHCLEPEVLRAFDRGEVEKIEALDKRAARTGEMLTVSITRIELAYLVDELRQARRQRDLVDFSDQMRFGAMLAENFPEVGAALREQFPVVLLDEYQDTSVAQRVLLTGLFGGGHPVTAVGDPLQAIYGWRGASVANIDSFPSHFPRTDGSPAPVRRLTENRRSGIPILMGANELAGPLRALHPQVLPLVSPADSMRSGGIRVALHNTYEEEMQWIGDRVLEQIDLGTKPEDIAVLARVRSDFPALIRVLEQRDIPVDVLGLGGMLAMPEVAEIVAVLEVLHDSAANPALVRLLSGPRWRIGLRDLALLGRQARTLAGSQGRPGDDDLDGQLDAAVSGVDPADIISLLDALDDPGDLDYDPEARRRFALLSAEIRSIRRGIGDPLPDLVHRVISVTGLDIEMASTPELLRMHRSEGLTAFVDLVATFANVEGESHVGAFLGWLSLASRFDEVPALDRPAVPGCVQLMTVHKSKGLEFPVVVLPSLTQGVFPGTRGITRWTKNAKAVPFSIRGDRESLPHLAGYTAKDHTAFIDACEVHSGHEDLRLIYVAVTRSERLVIASSSWWGPSQIKPRGPSPYLTTLRDQCIAGAGQVDHWAAAPADDAGNPAFEIDGDTSWPPASDPHALELRLEVAAQVRQHPDLTVADLRGEHDGLEAGAVRVPAGDSPLSPLAATDLEIVRGWDDDIELLLEERRLQRAPTRVVAQPSSHSASDLVRLAADPTLFTRRLARPVPAAPAPAARRGTRFHAWVESHFGIAPLLEPDDLPGAADEAIDSDDTLAAMQAIFLTSPYADRTPIAIEVPFALVIGGRVIPGRIDAVFSSTGPDGVTRVEVVDWKTNRHHDADPLQLAIYRLAYSELSGIALDDVDAAFFYVRDGALIRHRDLPDRAGLEALVIG